MTFCAEGHNLNFLETGKVLFPLHRQSFVLQFTMNVPGFIPKTMQYKKFSPLL